MHIKRYVMCSVIITSHTYFVFRRSNHFEVYKERCHEIGITMNQRAIPEDKASEGLQFVFLSFHCHNEPRRKYLYRQQVLDGNLVPKVPQYTKEGLLEYIVELIVSEDEASAI
jgi:hypothetical protein